jgi:hypothetical protein
VIAAIDGDAEVHIVVCSEVMGRALVTEARGPLDRRWLGSAAGPGCCRAVICNLAYSLPRTSGGASQRPTSVPAASRLAPQTGFIQLDDRKNAET